MVVEFCEGGDLYDLYARNRGNGMGERFVSLLLRQLLRALQHLVRRDVEHRDVKPENLLLFEVEGQVVPHLKLADFGWAAVVGATGRPGIPPDGVGSLWYAPPELNPPLPDLDTVPAGAMGQSDAWSAGIIAYLLLVGHNPFNLAKHVQDEGERKVAVMRCAALGYINTTPQSWKGLSADARSFVSGLVQPIPSARLSASEALGHAFMNSESAQMCLPLAGWQVRCDIWADLDQFQHLCWLSIARAVSEPELLQGPIGKMLSDEGRGDSTSYLEQLAVELAAAGTPSWFQQQTAWTGILQLGFRYLDVDMDGILSPSDLAAHVVDGDVSAVWIERWREDGVISGALTFRNFQSALWSSVVRRHAKYGAAVVVPFAFQADWSEDCNDEAGRLNSIELGCLRFLDEASTLEAR